MSLSISSAPAAADIAVRTPAHPAGAAATQGSSQAGKAQEQAALRQLVSQYSADIQQGQNAASLQSLASKIAADERIAGTSVTLPTGSGGQSAPAASGHALDKTA